MRDGNFFKPIFLYSAHIFLSKAKVNGGVVECNHEINE